MTWVRDEEALAAARQELADWEKKREEWEDDYAILHDQQLVIAQLYTACENNKYLTHVLDVSIDQIKDLADKIQVPSFDDLFDFDDLKSSGSMVSKFLVGNDDAQEEFKKAGEKIDELKQTLSANIKTANAKIPTLELTVSELESSYTIWVDD